MFYKKFEFSPNNSDIDKDFLGKFVNPLVPFKRVKSYQDVYIEHNEILGMIHLKSSNKIAINDCLQIKLFDISFNHLQTLNNFDTHGCLCSDNNDRILIENFPKGKIFIFDSNLNYVSEFPHLESHEPSAMQIDVDSTPNILYASYSSQNQISAYNIETGNCENCIGIDSPRELGISQEHIYALSLTGYDKKRNNGGFKKLKFGSNCIFLLHKADLRVIKKIEIPNWLCPNGLVLDKYSNLITTAFQVNNNSFVSNNRYIFVFDSSGQLLHKNEIEGIQYGNILITSDKLINWTSQEIKMVNFY